MAENSNDIHYQIFTVYSHYSSGEIATSIQGDLLVTEFPILCLVSS